MLLMQMVIHTHQLVMNRTALIAMLPVLSHLQKVTVLDVMVDRANYAHWVGRMCIEMQAHPWSVGIATVQLICTVMAPHTPLCWIQVQLLQIVSRLAVTNQFQLIQNIINIWQTSIAHPVISKLLSPAIIVTMIVW